MMKILGPMLKKSLCGSNPLDNLDTPVDFDGDKICDVMDEDRDSSSSLMQQMIVKNMTD